MKYLLFALIAIFILFNVLFAAWDVLHSDILFHTDLARDFLLFEDIVKNKPITLIGTRSGGISGLFHWPLWMYLNIPAFLIDRGNPVVVGWFWVFLYLAYLGIVYVVASKLFDKKIGVMSLLLASVTSVSAVPGLFNPFGAVMLSPIFFYFLYQYRGREKALDLVIALFVLGLIIQFQMAFGIPILFLTFLYLCYKSFKGKHLSHLFSFFILVIPLSTHILFELRHQFLETKSFLQYLASSKSQKAIDLLNIVISRIKGFSIESFGMIAGAEWWLLIPFILVFYIGLIKLFRAKKFNKKIIYELFFYLFAGFWILSLFYKGVVWGYYFWPFLSLLIIIYASLYKHVNRAIFYLVFITVLLFNFVQNVRGVQNAGNFFGKDGSSWRFNYDLAKTVFNDAPQEFGYYIFTHDLFGYSPRYAFNYVQDKRSDKKAFPFTKKTITYLIIAPPPDDRLFLNGEWWRINQVRIRKKPIWVRRYEKGFKVEKYELTDEELKIESDPNLIQTLFFR